MQSQSWWLDWSALPDRKIWALLIVHSCGSATVKDCDSITHNFSSAQEATNWLHEDEYSLLEDLITSGEISSATTPPNFDSLVENEKT